MQQGDFVKITFTGRIKGGEVFDTTDEELAKEADIHQEDASYGPKVVVLGQDRLIPGFQKVLMDSEVGDSGEVEIPPAEAFGERQDDAVISISKREFEKQADEPPRRGMQVDLGGQTGVIVSTVGGHVRIDTNHPLAGQTIEFEYEVLEKVEDPAEKVQASVDFVTGMDEDEYDVVIEGAEVIVEAPGGASGNQMWLFSKQTMANRIFAGLDDVREVRFVDSFENPEFEEVEEVVEQEESGEPEEAEGAEEEGDGEE